MIFFNLVVSSLYACLNSIVILYREITCQSYFCDQQEGLAAQEKVDELTKECKSLREENKALSDNYNSERVSQSVLKCVITSYK